jgi:predicted ATP-dependent endonuclease of OLD family
LKLTGIEISNFRSIGDMPVVLVPWQKCNILVGRNNTGKSNVIRAFRKIRDIFDNRGWAIKIDAIDRPKRQANIEISFKLIFEREAVKDNQELLEKIKEDVFVFEFSEKIGNTGVSIVDTSLSSIRDFHIFNFLISKLSNNSFRSVPTDQQRQDALLSIAPEFFRTFFLNSIPPIHTIPEFRQIQDGDEYSFDGKSLVLELAKYQNPVFGRDDDKKKFRRIEELVQKLLHLPDAKLEVTRESPTIVIESGGTRLPLSSYGTGVHELIILLTAVLSIENSICCIEEPEIHLHPTLQREFIEFITTETSNQYLITTHSSTLINANLTMPPETKHQIQVFHLKLADGVTVGGPVIETLDSLTALNDLGVKASDILQANSIIWVEGPSDRIYLNHWISLLEPGLIEGLHYSIMFYGGRLLSHLFAGRENADEKVPEELIEILRINQRAVVLMDSDRKLPHTRINSTKLRISKECATSETICWITDGREIENYLPPDVIIAALEKHSAKSIIFSMSPYEKLEEQIAKALPQGKAKSFKYANNKVEYAREFIQYFEQKHITNELRKQLDIAIQAIKKWNL